MAAAAQGRDPAAATDTRRALPPPPSSSAAADADVPGWADSVAAWVDTGRFGDPARAKAAVNLRRFWLRYAATAAAVFAADGLLSLAVRLDLAFIAGAVCAYRAVPPPADLDDESDILLRIRDAWADRVQFRAGVAVCGFVAAVTAVWSSAGEAVCRWLLIVLDVAAGVAAHSACYTEGPKRAGRKGLLAEAVVAGALSWREGEVLSADRLELFLDAGMLSSPQSARQALFRALQNLRYWHVHYAFLTAFVLVLNLALSLPGKLVVLGLFLRLYCGAPETGAFPDLRSAAQKPVVRTAAGGLVVVGVLGAVGGHGAVWHFIHFGTSAAALLAHLVCFSPQLMYSAALGRARDSHAALQARRRAALAKGHADVPRGAVVSTLRSVNLALAVSGAARADRRLGRRRCGVEIPDDAHVVAVAPDAGAELCRAAHDAADAELWKLHAVLLSERGGGGGADERGGGVLLSERGSGGGADGSGGDAPPTDLMSAPPPLAQSLAPGLGYGDVTGPPEQRRSPAQRVQTPPAVPPPPPPLPAAAQPQTPPAAVPPLPSPPAAPSPSAVQPRAELSAAAAPLPARARSPAAVPLPAAAPAQVAAATASPPLADAAAAARPPEPVVRPRAATPPSAASAGFVPAVLAQQPPGLPEQQPLRSASGAQQPGFAAPPPAKEQPLRSASAAGARFAAAAPEQPPLPSAAGALPAQRPGFAVPAPEPPPLASGVAPASAAAQPLAAAVPPPPPPPPAAAPGFPPPLVTAAPPPGFVAAPLGLAPAAAAQQPGFAAPAPAQALTAAPPPGFAAPPPGVTAPLGVTAAPPQPAAAPPQPALTAAPPLQYAGFAAAPTGPPAGVTTAAAQPLAAAPPPPGITAAAAQPLAALAAPPLGFAAPPAAPSGAAAARQQPEAGYAALAEEVGVCG
eukprot:TRINITY_DN2260_c2_g1_i2.p1 TRINITY_DN2260_c2_g1~~TRINITY_DN2260_c2_g1_i2.p1  ORF type:complete len:930 (+),score=421.29 TRINITY_DN2260_c2_g1_i2:52-2790(+)